MATAILPYTVQPYNSLPSIMDAGSNFKPADIALLTTTIGQVFVKHEVQKFFGIVLLHNHFSLDENEMLVNIGSVAVPCKTSSLAVQQGDVKGSAWRFTEHGTSSHTACPHNLISADSSHFFWNLELSSTAWVSWTNLASVLLLATTQIQLLRWSSHKAVPTSLCLSTLPPRTDRTVQLKQSGNLSCLLNWALRHVSRQFFGDSNNEV